MIERWLLIDNGYVVEVRDEDLGAVPSNIDSVQDDPNKIYNVGDKFDVDEFSKLDRSRHSEIDDKDLFEEIDYPKKT